MNKSFWLIAGFILVLITGCGMQSEIGETNDPVLLFDRKFGMCSSSLGNAGEQNLNIFDVGIRFFDADANASAVEYDIYYLDGTQGRPINLPENDLLVSGIKDYTALITGMKSGEFEFVVSDIHIPGTITNITVELMLLDKTGGRSNIVNFNCSITDNVTAGAGGTSTLGSGNSDSNTLSENHGDTQSDSQSDTQNGVLT